MNGFRNSILLAFIFVVFLIPIGIATAGHGKVAALLTVEGVNAQEQPAPKSFVVMITNSGFDNGSLHLVVNQGDNVQITFTLDPSQRNDTDPSNHHIIAIGGFGVKSADINPASPSATVTFSATNAGTFRIYCETAECPIHYLMLSGVLEVKAPGQTEASTTSVSVTSATSSEQSTTAGTITSGVSSMSSQTSAASATVASTPSTVTATQTVVITSTSHRESGGLAFQPALVAAISTLVIGLIAGMVFRPVREEAGR